MLVFISSSLSSCRANSHCNFLLSPKLGVRSPVFKKEIHFYALICLPVSFCVCVYLSACVWVCAHVSVGALGFLQRGIYELLNGY